MTVFVLDIIAAIMLPAYQDYIYYRTQTTEATVQLENVQQDLAQQIASQPEQAAQINYAQIRPVPPYW